MRTFNVSTADFSDGSYSCSRLIRLMIVEAIIIVLKVSASDCDAANGTTSGFNYK